jgi:hypothetical protein
MPLTTAQKSWLTQYTSDILSSFNTYKTQRAFMGVYSTPNAHPYCTFSNTNTFASTLSLGRTTQPLVCVYQSSLDFTTQTNTFLSS